MWSKPEMYVNAVADGTYTGTVFNPTSRITLHSDLFAWLQTGQCTPLSHCSMIRGPWVLVTCSTLNIFSHHIYRKRWKYFPLVRRHALHLTKAVVARRNFISYARRREVSSDRNQIISCPYSTRCFKCCVCIRQSDNNPCMKIRKKIRMDKQVNISITCANTAHFLSQSTAINRERFCFSK